MGLLSDESLLRARGVANKFFTSTAVVRTETESKDETGSPKMTWTSGATIPIRVIPYDASEVAEADRTAGRQVSRAYVAHNTSLTTKNRLVFEGKEYDIRKVLAPRSGDTMQICIEMVLRD